MNGVDDNEDEQQRTCPVCKTDRYLNPNMILLVSPCYHKMCEACVNRIFGSGAQPCPVCRMVLRKNHFTKPTFEDMAVEKECQIRKRIAKIFNKRAEEFESLREYNDYLEQTEEIVSNLVNDMNVQSMNERIEAYRQENAASIQKNADRSKLEAQQLRDLLEEEVQEFQERKQTDLEQLQREARERDSARKQIIADLASADANISAAEIVAKHVKSVSERKQEDETAAAPSLTAKLQGLHRQAGKGRRRGIESQFVLEDPFASPYERLTVELRDSYRDPILDSFDTAKHRAGGFTAWTTLEKSLGSMMEGLFT